MESRLNILEKALVNSIIENTELKNKLSKVEESKRFWYDEFNKVNKELDEIKNVEIKK